MEGDILGLIVATTICAPVGDKVDAIVGAVVVEVDGAFDDTLTY